MNESNSPVEPQEPMVENSTPFPKSEPARIHAPYASGPEIYRADPRMKSPFFAAFLSLVPGIGQIYVGYYVRGFVNAITVGTVISILTFSAETPDVPHYFPLLILFLIFFWLYNVIDAWRRAVMYNLTLQGVENLPMPYEMGGPGIGGSLFGGIGMVLVSLVILLHTRFGLPIEVLEQWWPVIPMAFGGFLVYRHFEDKKLQS